MEVNEILEAMRYNRGRFAREAVAAAIERRDEIIPHLLEILERVARNAEEVAADVDGDYLAHVYAAYLLAQFREPRACPVLVKAVSHSEDVCRNVWGDFVTEDLARVLASVAHGDVAPAKQLIENREISVWVRSAGLRCLVVMVSAGELRREEALEYFRELFRGRLEREGGDVVEVWNSLVWHADELYPDTLRDEIEESFQLGLVNPGWICPEDIERTLAESREAVLERRAEQNRLIEDTAAEMHWWACFEKDDLERRRERDRFLAAQDAQPPSRAPAASISGRRSAGGWGLGPETATATIVRDTAKVGRNDPCPCGSGKKHKKCCLTAMERSANPSTGS